MTDARPKRTRRLLDAIDERLGLGGLRYPIPRHSNGLVYSLGGITLGVFVLLAISGILLTQFYEPGEAAARQSVARLVTSVTLGRFLRGFHYWSAMVMVVLIALHVARVFITGAFKRPREANWLIGVGLASLTGLFFISGTILKWDQEAYEALTHNEELGRMLGPLGFWFRSLGSPLLVRFYSLHIAVLPLLFGAVVAAHLLLIKRLGMAPTPFYHDPLPEPIEPFTSHIRKLCLSTVIVAGIVAILAVSASPALGPLPEKGIEVTKPPWPVLWLYGVEDFVGVGGILWASLAGIIALAIVPFVDHSTELHPRLRLWIIVVAVILVAIVVALSLYAQLAPVEAHVET